MKKTNIFKPIFLAMLIGGVAFAADEVIRQDKVKIGKPGSVADKVIELDTGSVNNAQVSSDSSQRLKLRSNTVRKGRGTNTNIVDAFDTGAGNLPQFRWNSATGKIEFSNDGLTFKDVGSGGGAGGGGVVLNANPGFEEGSTNWTASGGTFTINTTLANVGFGLQSGSWDPSAASQTLSGELVAVPAGLYGKLCSLSWYYKGGDANYKAQVFDGTNVIAESSAFVTSTNFSAKQAIYFTCPSSGSIRPRFISSADAALIYLDDVKLGQEVLFSGNSNGLAVAGYIAQAANCQWDRTNTAFGPFTADADCPGPTVSQELGGMTLSTTDTDLPRFTVNNIQPGTYEVMIWGYSSPVSSSDTAFTINDGSTNIGRGYTQGQAGNATQFTAIGTVSYGTFQASKTFELYASNTLSTARVFTSIANTQLNFSLIKVDGLGSEAITIDKSGWRIDANLGGGLPALSTASVSSYTEITNGSLDLQLQAGSASAEVPCSSTNPSTGLTCSAGSESLGIVFTPPTAGTYEVCGAFTQEMDLAVGAVLQTSFQWVETPNNAQTILQESKSYAQAGQQISAGSLTQWPIYTCGTFTFGDTSKKTLRIMYEQSVSGTVNDTTIMIDRNAAIGQRDMKVTVRRRVEFADAVKFTNLVTTGQAEGVKIEAARIANNGTASITRQTGFVQAVNTPSTGRIDVTFVGGKFSVPPSCTCSGETSVYCYIDAAIGHTTSTLTDANVNFNANVALNCVGF